MRAPAELRLAALKMLLLEERHIADLCAQLSPDDAMAIGQLLASLRQQGFDRYPELVREFISAQKSPVAAPGEANVALVDLLRATSKPAWRMVIMQYMTPRQRQQEQQRLFPENPFVYRQLAAVVDEVVLPSAWLVVLQSKKPVTLNEVQV